MIRTFKHKGLKQFFINNNRKLLDSQKIDRIERTLDRLDAVMDVKDMDLPGYHLHELAGNRKGTWSVSVSDNWRLTFKFEKTDAFDLDLEDYH